MDRNLKVIILSAGQGRRLAPLTDERPKCLINLAGRSVLHWQLKHLRNAGVSEAVVVTGFGAELVDREISNLSLGGMRVRSLFNPFYRVSDNLATCWLAREEFKGEVLLLNGDSLFDPAVAEGLIAAPPADITVTIDRKASYDADDMKVETDGDRLVAIGKTISTYDAESIGFLRFSADGAALFAGEVMAAMRQPEGVKRWYLSVIDHIAHTTDRVRVHAIGAANWAEMDFPSDLPRNIALAERWAARALAG